MTQGQLASRSGGISSFENYQFDMSKRGGRQFIANCKSVQICFTCKYAVGLLVKEKKITSSQGGTRPNEATSGQQQNRLTLEGGGWEGRLACGQQFDFF